MSLTLRLILGDQLNPDHSWFNNVDPGVRYVMMEVRDETSYVLHHAQKIIAIFAAMRHFAQSLTACGHEVTYIQIDDPNNMHGIDRNLAWLIKQFQANALEYQAPDEWRLDQLMKSFCRTQSITCRMVDSEHFYTTREEAAVLFEGRKQWLMETFYRQMRIKLKREDERENILNVATAETTRPGFVPNSMFISGSHSETSFSIKEGSFTL